MSKRSPGLKRRKHDFYPTPPSAVLPLLPHLEPGTRFHEPCAGDGALIDALQSHGHVCVAATDLEPKREGIRPMDALAPNFRLHPRADFAITNPPWTRALMHPLILALSDQLPTWLLFDADWMHTKQAEPYLPRCHKIVSVGRVSWMGNGVSGMDNAAWYLFDYFAADTRFVGRAA